MKRHISVFLTLCLLISSIYLKPFTLNSYAENINQTQKQNEILDIGFTGEVEGNSEGAEDNTSVSDADSEGLLDDNASVSKTDSEVQEGIESENKDDSQVEANTDEKDTEVDQETSLEEEKKEDESIVSENETREDSADNVAEKDVENSIDKDAEVISSDDTDDRSEGTESGDSEVEKKDVPEEEVEEKDLESKDNSETEISALDTVTEESANEETEEASVIESNLDDINEDDTTIEEKVQTENPKAAEDNLISVDQEETKENASTAIETPVKAETVKAQTEKLTEFVYSAEIDGYLIEMRADPGVLPEGVVVEIEKVESVDGADIETLLKDNIEGRELVSHVSFDISLMYNDEEIEPEDGLVDVSIHLLEDVSEDEQIKVFHIDDSKSVDEILVQSVEDDVVLYAAESFSIYTVAKLSASQPRSGKLTNGVSWELSGNKDNLTLTVSGNGVVSYEYFPNPAPDAGGPWLLGYRDQIKKVIVKEGITEVGFRAFYMLDAVQEVQLPEGLTCIGYSSFDCCKRLNSINIPSSVQEIEQSAFARTGFTSFELPNSMDMIPSYLFMECTELKTVKLPSTVSGGAGRDGIGWGTFEGSAIEEIKLPKSVDEAGYSIGGSAFRDCTKLKKVVIPKDVVTIYGYAFHNCPSLTDIYYDGSEADWEMIDIQENNEALYSAKIHFNYTDGAYLTVVAKDDYGNKIDGAGFLIYKIDNNTRYFYNEADSTNIKWVASSREATELFTDNNGEAVTLGILEPGDYTLSEKTTPEKYAKPERISFSVEEGQDLENGNKTVVVTHKKAEVAVKFMVDGQVFKEDKVIYGNYVSPVSPPKKEGYSFDAWYATEDFSGSPYEFNTKVTKELSLYAKYNKESSNNSGSGSSGGSSGGGGGSSSGGSSGGSRASQNTTAGSSSGQWVWVKINGRDCWAYQDNGLVTGFKWIDGQLYHFGTDASLTHDAWIEENGRWYHFNNDYADRGWAQIDGTWYYFNDKGQMETGRRVINGKEYYFLTEPREREGSLAHDEFITDPKTNKVYYYRSSGELFKEKGTHVIKDKLYEVNDDGSLSIAKDQVFYRDNGFYYYRNGDVVKNEFVDLYGGSRYFGENGQMLTGLQNINGKLYYFDPNMNHSSFGTEIYQQEVIDHIVSGQPTENLMRNYNDVLGFLNNLNIIEEGVYALATGTKALDAIITGTFTEKSFADAYMYNEEECKKYLQSMMDSMNDTKIDKLVPSKEKSWEKLFESALNIAIDKEFGENKQGAKLAKDTVNGKTNKIDFALSLSDNIYKTMQASKNEEAKKYESTIAMLETLRLSVPDGSVMAKVIDRSISEYQDKAVYSLTQTISSALKDAKVFNYDLAKAFSSRDAFVTTVESALIKNADKIFHTKIGFGFKFNETVLGNDPVAKALDDITYGSGTTEYAMRSLQNAEERLKTANASGDPELISAALMNYNNCYELARTAKITQYKAMRDFYDTRVLKYLPGMEGAVRNREEYDKYDDKIRALKNEQIY